jgi:hypothetical protein
MEAIVKCFENKNCTRELKTDDSGYILDLSLLSSNNDSQYKKNIYVKNVGTHRAYRVQVQELSDSLNKCTLYVDKTELGINEVGTLSVSLSIVKGENKTGTLYFKLNYDNV